MINSIKARRLFVIIFAVIVLYILGLNIPKLLNAIYPIGYRDIIVKYADSYGLDPYLIAAIIKVESGYDSYARSSKGALGLMQIKPSTGEWIGEKLKVTNFSEEMLYDPEINIKMGCWYLDYLFKYYDGDIKLVLAAYNGGQGNVSKWLKDADYSDDGVTLKNIPFAETKLYVEKINRAYKMYNKIYRDLINK
ncbi:lytic transglycosylase domain-containing protein [Lutispora sp.]|uniref:lytic transglycosylase domain-containing protein n=1 Tax=Lutispora sp. TaxID=2828727 RepID=UPI002B20255D|nr:lytic transglycosylase domain-containing protein [Lutispora sp.]MEA4960511.1 lytic transglycosylase domain-containing protein [Lutispora sp.]